MIDADIHEDTVDLVKFADGVFILVNDLIALRERGGFGRGKKEFECGLHLRLTSCGGRIAVGPRSSLAFRRSGTARFCAHIMKQILLGVSGAGSEMSFGETSQLF